MADIYFNIAYKELKIAQIAQLNQPFQLLHLVHIYSHGFYELSRMLMRKNVNNDVSKDSPIRLGLVHLMNTIPGSLSFVMLSAPAKKSAGDARCARPIHSLNQCCPIQSRLQSV